MARRPCQRHGRDYPCTCAMGNLYRFIEPVVLLLLEKKGSSYGYDLAGEVNRYALTDAQIERAALYRTLRHLERKGKVTSEWNAAGGGPARRVYRLTPDGRLHLNEWASVMDHVSKSMARFVREVRRMEGNRVGRRPRSGRPHEASETNTNRPPAPLPPDGLRGAASCIIV